MSRGNGSSRTLLKHASVSRFAASALQARNILAVHVVAVMQQVSTEGVGTAKQNTSTGWSPAYASTQAAQPLPVSVRACFLVRATFPCRTPHAQQAHTLRPGPTRCAVIPQELDTVEYWGVLGSRGTWPKGPTSILLRTIYAVVGWPPSLSAQPADLSVDQPAETQDVATAVAAAAAALGIEPEELLQQQRRLKQQQQQQQQQAESQQVQAQRREAAADRRSAAASVGAPASGSNGVEVEVAAVAGWASVVEAGEGPVAPVGFAGVEARGGGAAAAAVAAAGAAAFPSRAAVGSGHNGGDGTHAHSPEVQAAAERAPAGANACASADGAAVSIGVGTLHGAGVVGALVVETVGQVVDTWDGGVLEPDTAWQLPDGAGSGEGAVVAGQALCPSSNGAGLAGSNGHGGLAEGSCDGLQQQQQVAAAVAVVNAPRLLQGGTVPGGLCSGVDVACAGDVDTCTCQSRAAAPAPVPGEATRSGRNGGSNGNGAVVPLGGGIDSEADVAALQGLRPVPVAVRVSAGSGASGRPGQELVFASRGSKQLS